MHHHIKFTEVAFQNLVSYWAGKLRLPLPLYRKDNRMKWVAFVVYCSDCKVHSITYNFKRIKTLPESEIAGIIFHELGHVKHKTCNWKNKVRAEYTAEKYSLKCLKIHYPDFYKIEVAGWRKKVKDKKWRKEFPIYAKAFNKIKEYQS